MTRRGLYIFPSLFTVGNLSAGMVSMLFALEGHLTNAAWAIIVAIAMDIVDGRVARWTKATSQFGTEFDSLADLTSFGIAPAVLMYQLVLYSLGRPGWALAVFFPVMGALRLAWFNVRMQRGEEGSPHFIGLPIPAAAGILASFVLSYELMGAGGEVTVKTIPLVMKRMPLLFKMAPLTMVVLPFLMVSTIRYSNFKRLKLSRPKPLQLFALIVVSLLLIMAYPQNTIFLLFLSYVGSGLWMYAWRYSRVRSALAKGRHRRRAMDWGQDPGDRGGIQIPAQPPTPEIPRSPRRWLRVGRERRIRET